VDTVDKPEIPRFAGFLATSLRKKIEIFLANRQESPFRNSNIQRQRGFPDWNATAVSTALWRSRMDIHRVILVDKPLQNQAGKGLSTASTSPTTTAEI